MKLIRCTMKHTSETHLATIALKSYNFLLVLILLSKVLVLLTLPYLNCGRCRSWQNACGGHIRELRMKCS